MSRQPQVEVKDEKVVAWFDGVENAVCLKPEVARLWAKALVVAADAADALAEIRA